MGAKAVSALTKLIVSIKKKKSAKWQMPFKWTNGQVHGIGHMHRQHFYGLLQWNYYVEIDIIDIVKIIVVGLKTPVKKGADVKLFGKK